MKRPREDDAEPCAAPHGERFSYQSPLRLGAQRSPWRALAGVSAAAEMTPTKRMRDRSMPMDALSRLMTAATSAARMKKRAQMTLTGLFGGAQATAPATASCSVCVATQHAKQAAVPCADMQRCAHCERAMGACCSRECDGCANVFCSHCSTTNCDEQYDRVFCLSCNYDHLR